LSTTTNREDRGKKNKVKMRKRKKMERENILTHAIPTNQRT